MEVSPAWLRGCSLRGWWLHFLIVAGMGSEVASYTWCCWQFFLIWTEFRIFSRDMTINCSWTYFKSNSKAIIQRLPIIWIRLIFWIRYTTWKRKYPKHFRGLYLDLYINRLEVECRRMLIKYTVKAKEGPGNPIKAMIGEPNTLSLMLVHVFAVQIRYARE